MGFPFQSFLRWFTPPQGCMILAWSLNCDGQDIFQRQTVLTNPWGELPLVLGLRICIWYFGWKLFCVVFLLGSRPPPNLMISLVFPNRGWTPALFWEWFGIISRKIGKKSYIQKYTKNNLKIDFWINKIGGFRLS